MHRVYTSGDYSENVVPHLQFDGWQQTADNRWVKNDQELHTFERGNYVDVYGLCKNPDVGNPIPLESCIIHSYFPLKSLRFKDCGMQTKNDSILLFGGRCMLYSDGNDIVVEFCEATPIEKETVLRKVKGVMRHAVGFWV